MMEGKKVLIVEDNKLNMKLIVALCELNEIETICTVDAETGLQLAREHIPDLILMDIQLPGMDGLTATRQLKESADLKDIPVVALTGLAMAGDKEMFVAAGCAGYISKPIDTRRFLEQIQSILNEQH